ncbi:transposase [Streptomyces albireticuli]|uniref:transposase n=1 Tax=Streptomyces albireticuli TaxID=1940 RepID=UPI001E3BD1F1|nr:transposase [Streptomyces albireticuli]MCD9145426.1 transposase [Streptomyces albireticuli]MCD9165009.1 transposase [Streptomyces albireticuli]
MFAFLAEHREAVFPEAMFADMHPSPDGHPSVPPGEPACVVVLQVLHGLPDVETVRHLRCDLWWKAARGLGLNDRAFDPSLLAYFRRRPTRSRKPDRTFEATADCPATAPPKVNAGSTTGPPPSTSAD